MITASGDEFNLAASSIPAPTWDYLTNLAWITAAENVALVGPAGTGKSHTLIACGVHAGHKIKYAPPRTWSKPSTAASPTPPSGGSSTPSLATR